MNMYSYINWVFLKLNEKITWLKKSIGQRNQKAMMDLKQGYPPPSCVWPLKKHIP